MSKESKFEINVANRSFLFGAIIFAVLAILFCLYLAGRFSPGPTTDTLVKEVRKEFSQQLEVINTGVPNKSFPWSEHAAEWERHSKDMVVAKKDEINSIATEQLKPLKVVISEVKRIDSLLEPKISAQIQQVLITCSNYDYESNKCLTWAKYKKLRGDNFEIDFET